MPQPTKQPRANVRIVDIARHLGVSARTVSQALSAHEGSTTRISPDTAQKIQELAARWNYRPDISARAMKGRMLKQAGILTESDFGPRRHHPVIEMPAILGLNSFLQEHDWHLNIIEDKGIRDPSSLLPRYLRERFLDGVVVASSSAVRDTALAADFERIKMRAVFLNVPGEVNCITLDDRHGVSLATRHLLEQGHTRIAFVGNQSTHHSHRLRLAGFQSTMRSAGLPTLAYTLDKKTEPLDYQLRMEAHAINGHDFIESFYTKERPTALVCYDDTVALRLMTALQQAGFSIPVDVSIVGYNDMPFVDLIHPSLTSVRSDFYAMGRAAGELLLKLIKGPKASHPSVLFKPELIVRGSTRPPRARASHPVAS
ncbi:MAG: LacI family DNA-binding transcriptional regulator [Rariglobus sp.]